MLQPKSVLEKFLAESIQTASEEIREELEAMKEGSDLSHSISVIERILTDLISSEPYDDLSLSPFISREAQNQIEDEIARKDVKLKYNIGDELIFDGTTYRDNHHINEFKTKFKLSDDILIGRNSIDIKHKTVLVIGRIYPILTRRNSYVVEHKGIIYFVDEDDFHESR